MHKYVVACVVSSILGALMAMHLFNPPPQSVALAQRQPVPNRTLIDDTDLDPSFDRVRAGIRATPASFNEAERVHIAVYEKVNRSVVHITTKSWSPEMFLMPDAPNEGTGSGSILDYDGHILTNDHVIDGASQVWVTLYNGSEFSAKLVGRDAANDTAVLRIEAPRKMLYPISMGDSTALRVGQHVYAIGNPFGLERTMTMGILSSLNRTLESRTGREMKSILQIDAALNPGNSGGPLLNSNGDLIGMNTAIASPSGAGENTGVGFSIPVGTLKRVVPELIEHGRVIRPTIGIAQVFENDRGLLIITLTPGGAAEAAGLQGFRLIREVRGRFVRTYVDKSSADMILRVDGEPVNTADKLLDIVEAKNPGDRVKVRVLRGTRELDVTVTLEEDD